MFELPNALAIAHKYMKELIREGDAVIDATAGNGKDTLLLASLVGACGMVYAFDVSQTAIERTKEKLITAALADRVRLLHCSHARIGDYVDRPIRFAAFNLGYLPGGDKSLTTQTESTLAAVNAAVGLLLPGGMCSVCVYPGHSEGEEERKALFSMLSGLESRRYAAIYRAFINQPKNPPELFAIQRIL